MSEVGRIYGLHSGDYRYRYVGRTTETLSQRFGRHKRSSRGGSKHPVHQWMCKYGWRVQCVELEVIHGEKSDLELAERKWIKVLGTSITTGGLNVVDGGPHSRGMAGIKHSDEARARMSASLRGIPRTDEWRRNASEAAKRRDPATRNNVWLGRQHSDETKLKMKASAATKPPVTAETREKLSAALRGVPLWSEKPKVKCEECGYSSYKNQVSRHINKTNHKGMVEA